MTLKTKEKKFKSPVLPRPAIILYLHGNNTQRIEEHESDYYQLLKIFALMVIKINEEFCLKDDLTNDDNL